MYDKNRFCYGCIVRTLADAFQKTTTKSVPGQLYEYTVPGKTNGIRVGKKIVRKEEKTTIEYFPCAISTSADQNQTGYRILIEDHEKA